MRKIKVPSQPRRIKVPGPVTRKRQGGFWHLHAHSRFSAKDSLAHVDEMVRLADYHGQPALALTDHGNMAGSVQLYSEAKKVGILPFPGVEAYLKRDKHDTKAPRFHVGLVAFSTSGYEALVKLSSLSHTRPNFHHYPHVDFSDFAEWSERGWTDGIALTTGCFFGLVQQTLVTQGVNDAKWVIKTLAHWFPHTYVELQHHNIEHDDHSDDEIVETLGLIASELGLPTVITQDAHYCHEEDRYDHETLKALVSWSEDPSEAVFPGDSFHLADSSWVESHYTGIGSMGLWERGVEGLQDLLDKHSLIIPELETYHYNVPLVTQDPLDDLKHRVAWAMQNAGFNQQRYRDRYVEEMEVVEATDMAGYLMLCADVCDWMRDHGIFYQTRGSASGSLLCWFLGITQVDPVLEKLRYERFLSKDRTKPPDVDLDVEDSRRGEVLQMLDQRFSVCQIGTWAEYSLDAETGRGSLFVDYLSRRRKSGDTPAEINAIKGVHDIPRDDAKDLYSLSKHEGYKSHGTHAGGLVVTTTDEEFSSRIPTMLVASSETTVTQFPMDDVEAMGFVKLDVLGQSSLTTIRRCVEMIGRDVQEGWDWIPLNDKPTFQMLRKGYVEGVFQLEGWTNRKGVKEMRVKKVKDLINLVALYRPALMETGMKDAFIERMAGWKKVPERNPMLDKALKDTYGIPVFQDQVITILRELGFSPDELTEFLKAVKASNKNIGDAGKVVARYQQLFEELADKDGWEDRDKRFTWDAIEGFAQYGFNKAHATTYGLRAYYMAYLKCHYPLEFHTALLQTWGGTPKEPEYVKAAKVYGLKLMRPDVNVSGATWTIDRKTGAIRKGLVSIKGIGEKAAMEIASHAPFRDVDDLVSRCDARAVNGGRDWAKSGTLNGVLGKLKDAGALKSLGV